MNSITQVYCLALLLLLFSCQTAEESNGLSEATKHIDAEGLAQHIEVLASDEFQGRLPFTIGEEKTVAYIEDQFKALGLEPGNGETYFQEVPLVEINSQVTGDMVLAKSADSVKIKPIFGEEFVALTRRVAENIKVEGSPLVFAGYGIVAPEYNWNDYEGLDVKGKTVVVMVNDPGYGSNDASFFKGNTMTYYGRWTYKYEEAAKQGATGVLIVHDTGPAGYPWGVVKGGWTGPSQYMKAADNNKSRCAFEGWLSLDVAKELLTFAEVDTALLEQAKAPGFKPVLLNNLKVWLELDNQIKEDVSRNVIATLPG
ncbi:MAG: peptidase M28, partial [Cyclobacteriaceae bacterium]